MCYRKYEAVVLTSARQGSEGLFAAVINENVGAGEGLPGQASRKPTRPGSYISFCSSYCGAHVRQRRAGHRTIPYTHSDGGCDFLQRLKCHATFGGQCVEARCPTRCLTVQRAW